jgi:hypothetical protein
MRSIILATTLVLAFGANVLHQPNFSSVQQVRACRTDGACVRRCQTQGKNCDCLVCR